MTKRIFAAAFIFLFIITLAVPGYCDDPLKKLGRGFCNVFTFPFELFAQPAKVNDTNGPMAAITYGVLKGVAMAGLRAGVGIYEVATFPFPFPKGYRPILTDPEFFFEDMLW